MTDELRLLVPLAWCRWKGCTSLPPPAFIGHAQRWAPCMFRQKSPAASFNCRWESLLPSLALEERTGQWQLSLPFRRRPHAHRPTRSHRPELRRAREVRRPDKTCGSCSDHSEPFSALPRFSESGAPWHQGRHFQMLVEEASCVVWCAWQDTAYGGGDLTLSQAAAALYC